MSFKIQPNCKIKIPVNQNYYRKHRKFFQPVTTTGDNGKNLGEEKRRKPMNRSINQVGMPIGNKHTDHGTPDLPPTGHGQQIDHTNYWTASEPHWISLLQLQRGI